MNPALLLFDGVRLLMANPGTSSQSSVRDFLVALASAGTPQDAVSASAVAAGIGVSLLMRVTALPKTKSDSLTDKQALMEMGTALRVVQEQLLEAIDTETAVKVFATRKMPQASARERAERDAAIQLALRAAADVPLEVMRLSTEALTHAQRVAAHGCHAAATDIELAVALLREAVAGARTTLETKLTSLTNVLYTRRVVEEIARLTEEAATAARAAELLVEPRPA